MRAHSATAKAYVLGVCVAGTVVIAWALAGVRSSLDTPALWLFLVAIALASFAEVRFVEGPTGKCVYNLGLVVYGFTLVVLGVQAAVAVMVVSYLIAWLWNRDPWFIDALNACAFALSLAAAGGVLEWFAGGWPSAGLREVVALLGAGAVIVLLNHVLVGLAIRLVRDVSFGESGVLGLLSFVIDATLVGIGIAAGVIWTFNPYASVFAVIPLYLISVTLRVPSLERQAFTDSKTGLFNARYFQEALAREFSRSQRFDQPLTVVLGDLDLLRNVNNLYGHLAGDVVLAGVAQILRDSVRGYDVVARFGGEEFTILMPQTTLEEALPRVDAIREAIVAATFAVATSATPISVTMSFGVAERESDDVAPDDILHRADLAVYRAKLQGRNRLATAWAPWREPKERPALPDQDAPEDVASAIDAAGEIAVPVPRREIAEDPGPRRLVRGV